jgi:formylglycine-generating enzyme required for sulfatase activity
MPRQPPLFSVHWPLLVVVALVMTNCGGEVASREGTAQGAGLSWVRVSPAQVAEAARWNLPVAFENHFGMRFVLIPPGTFTMGSPEHEEGRHDDEQAHTVTLTKPYYLQVTEITNRQYRQFDPKHDSRRFGGLSLDQDGQPVVQVSWKDAEAFVQWLNRQDREHQYRLPTEAEWERACRAGTSSRWYWGDDEAATGRYANVKDRTFEVRWPDLVEESEEGALPPPVSRDQPDDGEGVTATVGRYLPNAYGLYDMSGNVLEWCQDTYGPYPSGVETDPSGYTDYSERVVYRGGSWAGRSTSARSACRHFSSSLHHAWSIGFRVAATPK